jgi:hypothetical protein
MTGRAAVSQLTRRLVLTRLLQQATSCRVSSLVYFCHSPEVSVRICILLTPPTRRLDECPLFFDSRSCARGAATFAIHRQSWVLEVRRARDK